MAWGVLSLATARGDEGLPRKYAPAERMAPARLKATHEGVLRLRDRRRAVPPLPGWGWDDARGAFHAHAEDSAHTGGTRPEMLADAKRAGVRVIFLSNHHRPPTDFIAQSWRGVRDGVLFVPGSEARGFLLHPTRPIMDKMDLEPTAAFVAEVRKDGGLIFLSHIEERLDHPMDGLDGMEIYNRHADAKKDKAGLIALALKLTDPASVKELEESLKLYPDELFASQVEYPADYLGKWDRETPARRLAGVAANDCHHNNVLLVKMVDATTVLVGTNVDSDEQMQTFTATLRPGIRKMTEGRKAGDILASIDLDPYHRSFLDVSTHLLLDELSEGAARAALRAGRAYVAHDWMCDPTGFRYSLRSPGASPLPMGSEARFAPGASLVAEFPVDCRIRLLRDGKVVADETGDRLEFSPDAPGVYRVEGWLELDGEPRGWIYSNPIYLREATRPPASSGKP